MGKYNGILCEHCKKAFTNDDDIVVCPVCGAPHHRECYVQNGNCANADKHGTNEPIEVEFVDVEEPIEEEANFSQTEEDTNEKEYISRDISSVLFGKNKLCEKISPKKTIEGALGGEIGVILLNNSKNDYLVEDGQKIAQLVICPFYTCEIAEVKEVDQTDRNEGGFGSTGLK